MTKDDLNQFSLGLFSQQTPEILKKPVQASQMIVNNGVLTGQQLIAWNVMLKNAKEHHEAMQRTAKGGGQVQTSIYRIPRVKLMADMGYSSTNRKPLKDALKKMQVLTAEWDILKADGNNVWSSCVLLPYVAIDKDFVEYSYIEHIKPMLFESEIYSRLDISMQRLLKLDSSKKLYDWLNRYRTNPSHMSNKDTWEFWRTVVHGPVEKDSYLNTYKLFKRDKLLPAIEEINRVVDLVVELIEDKNGSRKVQLLQFKVTEKPKFKSSAPELVENSDDIIRQKLKELDLSAHYRKKVMEFPPAVILANIDYVNARLNDQKGDKINNIGAYLIAACTSNYAATEPMTVVPSSEEVLKSKTGGILAAIYEARTTNAMGLFNEYSEDDQHKLIKEYNDLQLGKESKISMSGRRLNRQMIPFYKWIAIKTWGDPTPEEIIEFTLSKQKG